MNTNKKIYIFEILLLIYIIILKVLFIDANNYYKLIISVSFPLITFLSYKLFGFQKDRNKTKSISVEITFITLLLFLLISFLLGLFLGFNRTQLDVSILGIFKNVYYLVILIISEEIIRYIIAKKCYRNKMLPIIFITIIFIIMDLFLMYNFNSYTSEYELFLLITTSFLPSVIRNIVSSYICYKVSFIPGLILRLFFGIYNYILPIYPDLGYYLNSILWILVPYIIYIFIFKYINLTETNRKYNHIKKSSWYFTVSLLIILFFSASLVTGIFKYQIIAIGSGSMHPSINYGDAVIFEHLRGSNEINTLKKGDILVFYHDNNYITHRVIKIYKNDNNVIKIKTKGDYNKENDSFTVNKKDIVGKVIFKIKYIGRATLWFNKYVK